MYNTLKILESIEHLVSNNVITHIDAADKIKICLKDILSKIADYPVEKAQYNLGFKITDYFIDRKMFAYEYVSTNLSELLECLDDVLKFYRHNPTQTYFIILSSDVEWLNMVETSIEILKANIIPLGLIRTTEGYDPKETVDLAKKVLGKC